jgi:hypothetical protein
MNESTSPTIDFLILADKAEAVNGKLYMVGGGWDSIAVRRLEEALQFSLAIGILVPWHATSLQHEVNLSVQDADGKELVRLQFAFKTGRPPLLPDGATQRVMLVLPFSLTIPQVGQYFVEVAVGEVSKRVTFYVSVAPQFQVMQPPGTSLPSI